MMIRKQLLARAVAAAAGLALTVGLQASAQPLADSIAEFSGVQGQDGWTYGYRSYTYDGGETNYDPSFFIPFEGGEGFGGWDGFSQMWDDTTSQWDLETAATGPWTYIASEGLHPNGENSFPNEEQWAIRRWTASGLSGNTLVALAWHTRKAAAAGNGVTGGIWINGQRLTSVALAGSDTTGVTRTNYVSLRNGDLVDLVLTPVGPSGDRTDGSDGSLNWMTIEVPADTDTDGLPDSWELLYAPDLTVLSASGDKDADGLNDAAELARSTNPTVADTDGDGLRDAVETDTGTFVSATNTGTDPLRADTDGDGRTDGEEVNGTPTTDVFNPDTDEDTYSDGAEVSTGHDPNDPFDTLVSSLIANSMDEFSGNQSQDGWYFGYRNTTADGGEPDYDPVADFVAFPGGDNGEFWDGTTQVWTGSQWDLNTASAAPWTEMGRENAHPNGANNGAEHWVVRRWEASELTEVTPLALRYHARKSNTGCGNGVTVGIYINGQQRDSVALAFNDGTGFLRTYFANVAPDDTVDVILSPRGADGVSADGCDGSNFYLHVDPVLPALAIQPNGDLFIPAGAGDTDADGIADVWEFSFFPGDLTQLTATGDYDSDGLKDVDEAKRDSDPTKPDTDGDGLTDLVETKTGTFVSASDTGTDPRKADTDGDTLSDSAEITGQPATDPTKADTDGDTFLDAEELAEGTDPNDAADNPKTFVIADSVAEFSGVQGKDGWYNGYRNYTVDGGGTDYDPNADFIPYPGGEGEGDWDGFVQLWTGSAWDMETAAAGPWTFQNAQSIHPNGENSFPNEEHWAIRRWIADELTGDTQATIVWRVVKENAAGGGVTGLLFVNGQLADSQTIAGDNNTNPKRRYPTVLKKGDIVDLALSPENADGTRADGSDGSITWFLVDTRPPAVDGGELTVSWDGANVQIAYPSGSTLEAASSVAGPWSGVAGAANPYVVTPSVPAQFYRSRR